MKPKLTTALDALVSLELDLLEIAQGQTGSLHMDIYRTGSRLNVAFSRCDGPVNDTPTLIPYRDLFLTVEPVCAGSTTNMRVIVKLGTCGSERSRLVTRGFKNKPPSSVLFRKFIHPQAVLDHLRDYINSFKL